MKYVVDVPKNYLRMILIVLSVIALTVLGYFKSPRGEDGRTMFLSPRMAQISKYQQNSMGWVENLREIQAGLEQLLSNRSTELLEQDALVNRYSGRLRNLQAELDGTSAPPTLEALHSSLVETVAAYIEASSWIASWISEPSQANYLSAQEALDKASSLLARLDQNPWVRSEP